MRRLSAYFLLTGTFFLFASIAVAQTIELDSLKRRSLQVGGEELVEQLNLISGRYYAVNTDSAFFYAVRAETLSRQINYWQGTSDALHQMGDILRERRRLSEAEQYFRKALSVSSLYPSSDNWYRDNLALGDILCLRGDYQPAIQQLNRSLQYYHAAGKDSLADFTYRELGTLYTELGYYEKAFSYFQKAIPLVSQISDPIGSHSSPYMWLNYLLGSLYRDAGDISTALDFYTSSLQRAIKNKSPDDYYRILGEMAAMKGQNDSAIYYYYRHADVVRERIPDTTIAITFLSEPFVNLGEACLLQHQHDSALYYFSTLFSYGCDSAFVSLNLRLNKDMAKTYLAIGDFPKTKHYAALVLERALQLGARQYIRDAYEILWQLFDRRERTDSAYFYYRRFISARDEIARDIQFRNIAVEQMKTARQASWCCLNSSFLTISRVKMSWPPES